MLRYYLSEREVAELGRVVMLGPPNQGSSLAEYISAKAWLSRLSPPAGRQLGGGEQSLLQRLGPVDFELGVIAGTANRRPLVGRLVDGPSDGTVSVAETQVEGMRDFVTVDTSHTMMMWNREVLMQTARFLRRGSFEQATASSGDDQG